MGKRNKVLEYGTNNRAGMREAEGGRVEIVSITPNERAEKEREREGGGEREKERERTPSGLCSTETEDAPSWGPLASFIISTSASSLRSPHQ